VKNQTVLYNVYHGHDDGVGFGLVCALITAKSVINNLLLKQDLGLRTNTPIQQHDNTR